ncbi:hypothetical protein HYG81_18790 [Natrinema zhouii]|uniref:hypothetical protein n=1 Tax=Natrinema zhouii TaxID=1710539 RepID=UPI001CF7BED4|nr:hypothetical protein [Natrinema zhouii]UHQ97906.1 hypothetical protein HYG81_18790 [Natrinema zhouii]
MTEFDPVPDADAVDEVRQRWRETTDTFGRVYDTVRTRITLVSISTARPTESRLPISNSRHSIR